MGSSSKTLQSVVDYLQLAGDLAPQSKAAGYAVAPLLALADDTMNGILGERFPWKFNSYKCAPFYTNSWQQDYPMVKETGIGWLEHAVTIDINNTALPKPRYWPECVRDLEPTSWQQSPFPSIAWEYNSLLEYGHWPGAQVLYVTPVGATQIPTNPPTAFIDANGNILLLTGYGMTGLTQPSAPAASLPGVTVKDGSCVWTVCNPLGQGFRLGSLPPQGGVVYLTYVVAQRKPPVFTSLSQTLDPLPDDYAPLFREGFKAHATAISPDARVRATATQAVAVWQASIERAMKKGDREAESKGFVPERHILGGGYWGPIGPANPYGRW